VTRANPPTPRTARVLVVGAGGLYAELTTLLGPGMDMAAAPDAAAAMALLPPRVAVVDLAAPGLDDPAFPAWLRATRVVGPAAVVALAGPDAPPAWAADPSAVDLVLPRPTDLSLLAHLVRQFARAGDRAKP
jgi:hypothetical protein